MNSKLDSTKNTVQISTHETVQLIFSTDNYVGHDKIIYITEYKRNWRIQQPLSQ